MKICSVNPGTWLAVVATAMRIWVFALITSACVVPRPGPAPIPRPGPELTIDQARDVYARSRLHPQRCGLGSLLSRDDGSYTYVALRDELGRYDASRSTYNRIAQREQDLLFGLGLGLSLVASAGVDHLAAVNDRDVLQGTGRGVVYAVGGALVVTTVLVALRGRDRVPDLAKTYNAELRAELRLDPTQTRTIDGSPPSHRCP